MTCDLMPSKLGLATSMVYNYSFSTPPSISLAQNSPKGLVFLNQLSLVGQVMLGQGWKGGRSVVEVWQSIVKPFFSLQAGVLLSLPSPTFIGLSEQANLSLNTLSLANICYKDFRPSNTTPPTLHFNSSSLLWAVFYNRFVGGEGVGRRTGCVRLGVFQVGYMFGSRWSGCRQG